MSHSYDVAVVGGGPGGYVAAIRAAQYGLSTVLFEGEALGGTCLNWGCIPTKAMLHTTDVLHEIRQAGSIGIDLGGAQAKPDIDALYAYKDKAVKKLTKGVGSLLKGAGVEVIRATAELSDAHTLRAADDPEKTVTARNIILALGSRVVVPPIPGLAEAGYWTSRSVLSDNPALPESLVIIGGGVIGVEFANIYNELGVKVTVVEMMDQLLPLMDAELAETLKRELTKAGITVETGVKVTEVSGTSPKRVQVTDADGARTLEAAEIMVAVGRTARIEMPGLEAAGVRVTERGIPVGDTQQTSVPHIYAIGDVTGRWQLAHAASAEGVAAVDHIAGKPNYADRNIVPSCVYTRPEVAAVGMTEKQAQEAGYRTAVGTFPLAANSKAQIMGEGAGFAKIVSDEATGAVLGAHLTGPRSTELIAEIAVAMTAEATVEEVSATIHPHPTVSEAIMESFHDIEGLSVHKPPQKRRTG